MDVRGPIPFHASVQAARAYGVAQPARTAANPASGLTPNSVAATTATPPAARADRLVAGRVSVNADPSLAPTQAPSATTAGGSFALYNRAADRIEVATSVAIGRTVDRQA